MNVKSDMLKRKSILVPPISRSDKGLPGDIAKFYSSLYSKYTGNTSHNHSLSRNQVVYFAQCNIGQLTASQGMERLINMIDTQSLAGTFYLNEVYRQVQTLEEAFDKLFSCSRQSTNYILFVREWRGLWITQFKNDNSSCASAMENFMNEQALYRISKTKCTTILNFAWRY